MAQTAMTRLLRRLLFDDEPGKISDQALIRTHLANERTFLAWLRSAVVLLGVGLGAIALGTGNTESAALAFALGGITVVTAIVMVLWAYTSFYNTIVDIEKRSYRPPRRLVTVASLLVIITGVVVLAVLLVEMLD